MDPLSIHSLTASSSAHLAATATTNNHSISSSSSSSSSSLTSLNNEQQFEINIHQQQTSSQQFINQNQYLNQGLTTTQLQQQQHQQLTTSYLNLKSNSNYSNKLLPPVLVNQSIVKVKTESHQSHYHHHHHSQHQYYQQQPLSLATNSDTTVMNVGPTNQQQHQQQQHNTMIPSAHGSGESQSTAHYTLPNSIKTSSDSSSSGIALNFSHDLSQHQPTTTNSTPNNSTTTTTSHHSQQQQQQSTAGMHQHSDNNSDTKLQHLSANHSSFDPLDSGSLMQSAAVGMNMWKNTMSLNHFKHPAIVEHNFLPNSDLNSFSSWPHTGNNLCNQTSSMTHHILDGQHLIGYGQHQRQLPISGSELVGATIKGQSSAEQASFMLNSINHQTSASSSQNSSSSHQTTQLQLDSHLNLRSHPLDHHSASYNLSMNDNQFYNSSRSESRSHPNAIKPSFMVADRSVHMSLNSHHPSQLSYHNTEHASVQPTTSHQHLAAGSSSSLSSNNNNSLNGNHNNSSSSSSSKNSGSFICSTCNEVFTLRTVYQSHIKTHSQDKALTLLQSVSKAKFACELCGHSFSQKTSLNRHMKSHTGERPFPCDICNKAFSEKERLKIHMRTHTGEKPFSCGICGKSFSQKSTVKRHQTVHTGEKKFRCDCGKGFANRGNLIAHIKTRGSNHFE